jgi:predicted RNA-binding Zn ribbon-like protein
MSSSFLSCGLSTLRPLRPLDYLTGKHYMTGEMHHDANGQPGGRNPAPGELALVQTFLNTRWDLTAQDHGETLVSPAALHEWLEARGLIGRRDPLDPEDLDRALATREGLRALAFANNQQELNTRAIDRMRRASVGAASQIRIEPDGPQFVAGGPTPIDAAIGAIFAITARAMIDGTWQRLKACPGRGCGGAFYDHSRNQSARWCSMKVCGDREKARAYYQRKTGLDRS